MATRNSSSMLVSQLLRASKTSHRTSVSSASLARCARSPAQLSSLRTPSSRYFSTTHRLREESRNSAPTRAPQSQVNTSSEHRKYSFSEIQTLAMTPGPNQLLIDVREPQELENSGTIPTSLNLPLKTSPDFMFLNAEEFEDRFGRPRPGPDDEVIFYCRSGVRSKAAAELAKQAGFGGTVSEFPGSWLEWEKNGGKVEKA